MLFWSVPVRAELRPLFDSIREVESGGNRHAVGDGGRSLGPYQIQRSYWRDAGVPGRYAQVRDPAYAERVMIAYWKRYCPESLAKRDYKTLARVHNGGASGARKAATLHYWRKVNKELRERQSGPTAAKSVRRTRSTG
ncbi:MAG: hypothetical protein HRF43_16535 [Phycisphaerae bacterium]|jgi:hypothetical protein